MGDSENHIKNASFLCAQKVEILNVTRRAICECQFVSKRKPIRQSVVPRGIYERVTAGWCPDFGTAPRLN
jgi:hypothetical protein